LELINTEVTASLAQQSDAGSSIDTKAILLVGYAGVSLVSTASRSSATLVVMARPWGRE
jgi:hypothetical protein